MINIVDTNVAIVANRDSDHADARCELACVEKLEIIVANERVALDSLDLIFQEYQRHLNFKGPPKIGDIFFKHLHNNRANTNKVIIQDILEDNNKGFVSFPDNPELSKFDPSDRKFVAVAINLNLPCIIINATDSDWAQFHTQLNDEGLSIEFLCPQHVQP